MVTPMQTTKQVFVFIFGPVYRIPGMGGIKKRQTKKESVLYKVFIDYSFVVPALIDAGEIQVLPNRRNSWM